MPAQYFSVVTLVGQGRIAAAIAGEGAVAIAELAAGDGNGAPTVPAVNQQGLVHEIWRGAVASVARDPAHPTQVIVRGTVPGSVGPAIIRELGVYSAAGELVAVANYPATEIAAAGQGALTDIVVDFIFVVDTAAPVTIQVNSNDLVYLQDQRRAPFISIDAFTNDPPANPAEDTLVVAGAAPTGAFAGSPHYFFQWNGLAGLWRQALAHVGTIVHDKTAGTYHRRTADGWEPWEAARTRKGIVRIATAEEVAAGVSESTAVCPKDLSDALGDLADTPLANVGAAGVGIVKGLSQDGSAWEVRKLAVSGGIVAAVAEGGEVAIAGPAHANVGGAAAIVKELATLEGGAKEWRHRTIEGTGNVTVTPSQDGDTLVVHGAGDRYPGEVVIRQRQFWNVDGHTAIGGSMTQAWTGVIAPKADGNKMAVRVVVGHAIGGGAMSGTHDVLDMRRDVEIAYQVDGGAWVVMDGRTIGSVINLPVNPLGTTGSDAVVVTLAGDVDVPVGAQQIRFRLRHDAGSVTGGAVEVIEYQTLAEA